MNRYQLDVLEFHRAFGHRAPDHVDLDGYPYRARADFVLEEAREYAEASGFEVVVGEHTNSDMRLRTSAESFVSDPVRMIDASFDLIYFALGNLVAMGVDLDPFWDAGHAANMAKLQPDGTCLKRSDGKIIKPAGWTPADFASIFARVID